LKNILKGKKMPNLFNDEYENLASKGRYGDTMLAHITPEEAALLKARGGAGTINPRTGLPEFYGMGQLNYLAQNPFPAPEPLPVLAQAFDPNAFQNVAGQLQTITVPQEIRGMGGHTPAYEKIAPELAQYANKTYAGMGSSTITGYTVPTDQVFQGKPLEAKYDPKGNFQYMTLAGGDALTPDPNQPNILSSPRFNKTGGIIDYGIFDRSKQDDGGLGGFIGELATEFAPMIIAGLVGNFAAGNLGGLGGAAGASSGTGLTLGGSGLGLTATPGLGLNLAATTGGGLGIGAGAAGAGTIGAGLGTTLAGINTGIGAGGAGISAGLPTGGGVDYGIGTGTSGATVDGTGLTTGGSTGLTTGDAGLTTGGASSGTGLTATPGTGINLVDPTGGGLGLTADPGTGLNLAATTGGGLGLTAGSAGASTIGSGIGTTLADINTGINTGLTTGINTGGGINSGGSPINNVPGAGAGTGTGLTDLLGLTNLTPTQIASILSGLGNLTSGVLSGNAAKEAAQIQADAATKAAQMQMDMFNTVNAQGAPYRGAGYNALNQIGGMLPGQYTQYDASGKPIGLATGTGYLTQQYGPEQFQKDIDPGYAFRLQQGQMANQRASNLAGGLIGGNALQGMQDYTQGMASQEFGNAFNRFQTQRGNIYNTLAGIAGIGQTAQSQANQMAQNTATAQGQLGVGSAAAQAAGRIGQATGYGNAATGLGNAYLLSQLLSQNQGVARP
jgi:hypothetical protein